MRRVPILFILLFTSAFLFAEETEVEAEPNVRIAPPVSIMAMDNPSDEGGVVVVSWEPSPTPGIEWYEICRKLGEEDWVFVKKVRARETSFMDAVPDNVPVYYKIRAIDAEGNPSSFIETTQPAIATPQWFDTHKANVLIAVVIFVAAILMYLRMARTGKELFLRRIAGLDALDEAVGRATEMGRPILYVPGLSSMADVATIAAINILGPVAKKAAEYEAPLIVPNRDPIVMTVAQQVVKEAYTEAGRPDAYNPDSVFFVTDGQFAYAAAVDGIMVRERPATNLFMGMFYAESLILAETGNSTGAIQIAGTDAVAQLPFFVVACDYTIIGEELYATSAYLSREPKLLGTLKAQDFGKLIILSLLVLGSVLGILGSTWIVNLLSI